MADERVAGKPAGSSECYRLTPRGVWPPGVLEVERGEPPREKRRELATMTRDREEFVAILSRELSNEPTHKVVDLARKLCRLSARHCRLQVAQCNGDWPADNGERATDTCPKCEGGWVVGTVKKKGCPDCRCEDSIRSLLQPYGLAPVFDGDPRGCTVKVKFPSGRTNDLAGIGVCVPQ